MNIYTLTHVPTEDLPEGVTCHVAEGLSELHTALSAGQADLLLIGEEHAEALLTDLSTLVKTPWAGAVIIIVPDEERMRVATYQKRGAATAWLESDWEYQLHRYCADQLQLSKNERSLSVLNGRKMPLVIAVASSYHGNGCTHTALMIAKYLQSIRGARVAVVEATKEDTTFRIIEQEIGATSKMDRKYGFTFQYEQLYMICSGIAVSALETIIHDSQFEYVVLDLGVLEHYAHPSFFFQADMQVLLSARSPWNVVKTLDALENFSPWPKEEVRIVLPRGTRSDRQYVAELIPTQLVHTLTGTSNPLELTEQVIQELHIILAPLFPRSKRQDRLMSI